MTDIELTEFAAKAFGNAPYGFSPLTDDGDALRLAVKLGMGITCHAVSVDVPNGKGGIITIIEQAFRDPEATRRAIVRAAAEIGKGMK